MEVLHARYREHAFDRHAHEGFTTSVIDRGVGSLWYRGETVTAPAGSLVLLDPGEAHTGQVIGDGGWDYRALYSDPALLGRVARELLGHRGACYFPHPVVHDRRLAASMDRLHRALAQPEAALARESWLVATYADLLTRHAEHRIRLREVGRKPAAVVRAREYLEACYARNVGLEELSAVAGLSRYHLIWVFRESVGLPPHAYLNQVRLRRAKDLLASGVPIGLAAREVGFVDQSHLTRRFKGVFGVTPGRFVAELAERPL